MLKKPKQVPKEPKVAANVSPHYSGLAYHISDLSFSTRKLLLPFLHGTGVAPISVTS
jgi:hypothetical protein